MIHRLFLEMVQYYSGDPKRIQHFTKVHAYAKWIGRMEQLDERTMNILEAAALVHDIGIKNAEAKFGSCGGKLQEQEGPSEARTLLTRLGFDAPLIDRVCYLVGHHHTYHNIDGADYQILVEADFLVNLYEDSVGLPAVISAYRKLFRTEGGRLLCRIMFQLPQED